MDLLVRYWAVIGALKKYWIEKGLNNICMSAHGDVFLNAILHASYLPTRPRAFMSLRGLPNEGRGNLTVPVLSPQIPLP